MSSVLAIAVKVFPVLPVVSIVGEQVQLDHIGQSKCAVVIRSLKPQLDKQQGILNLGFHDENV
jgi:hypothetical protein